MPDVNHARNAMSKLAVARQNRVIADLDFREIEYRILARYPELRAQYNLEMG